MNSKNIIWIPDHDFQLKSKKVYRIQGMRYKIFHLFNDHQSIADTTKHGLTSDDLRYLHSIANAL